MAKTRREERLAALIAKMVTGASTNVLLRTSVAGEPAAEGRAYARALGAFYPEPRGPRESPTEEIVAALPDLGPADVAEALHTRQPPCTSTWSPCSIRLEIPYRPVPIYGAGVQEAHCHDPGEHERVRQGLLCQVPDPSPRPS